MKNTDTEKSLSELCKEFRIKWYRCPIEAKDLRELSKRSDAKGGIRWRLVIWRLVI
jgi:hypothetical protein